jgi:predicted O-methyltransferase YrrM
MKALVRQVTPPILLEMGKRLLMGPPTSADKGIVSQDIVLTNTWFAPNKENWDVLLSKLKPSKILEIGSYEGASACFLIERLAAQWDIELHCVDSWEGGIEHQAGANYAIDMNSVEKRFNHNTSLAIRSVQHKVTLVAHKSYSDIALAKLISDGKQGYFDFIYVDGSHQAPDVLLDAVMSFKLLRVGGVLAFDDYLWAEGLPGQTDPLRCPKPAIDAFVNIHIRKIKVIRAPLSQFYVEKLAD